MDNPIDQDRFLTVSVRRLNFVFLNAWVMLTVGIALFCWLYAGQDFRGYYAAAKALLAGQNPYDYGVVSKILLDVTGYMGNNPYYYTPWFVMLIAPVALVPYDAARLVWQLVNAGLWMAGLGIAWPLFVRSGKEWHKYLIWITADIAFLWVTLRYEQVGVLLFFLVVITLRAYLSDRQWVVGFLLTLLLIKPTVMALVVAGFLFHSLRDKKIGVWVGFFASLAGFLVIFTLIIPGWYQSFFKPGFGMGLWSVLDGPDVAVSMRINTTFRDWLGMFGLPRLMVTITYALMGVFIFWFVGREWLVSGAILRNFILTILVSYWVTPYALQYDFPPLVLVGCFIAGQFGKMPRHARLGTLAIWMGMVTVVFWERPISDGFWLVIGISAAFTLAYRSHASLGSVAMGTK